MFSRFVARLKYDEFGRLKCKTNAYRLSCVDEKGKMQCENPKDYLHTLYYRESCDPNWWRGLCKYTARDGHRIYTRIRKSYVLLCVCFWVATVLGREKNAKAMGIC